MFQDRTTLGHYFRAVCIVLPTKYTTPLRHGLRNRDTTPSLMAMGRRSICSVARLRCIRCIICDPRMVVFIRGVPVGQQKNTDVMIAVNCAQKDHRIKWHGKNRIDGILCNSNQKLRLHEVEVSANRKPLPLLRRLAGLKGRSVPADRATAFRCAARKISRS